MSNTQPTFIPLFFDDSEMELWVALQRIEPEERSSFIKATLSKTLLGNQGNYSDTFFRKETSALQSTLPEPFDANGLKGEDFQPNLDNEVTESPDIFSLEDLFETGPSDSSSEQEVKFDQKAKHETTPIFPAGFEYMMKHIIGTEEDEQVLKVLRTIANNDK